MAALDSIREVLNEITTGCRAVDSLAHLSATAESGSGEDVTNVLLYVGWKLKADSDRLDEIFNKDVGPVLYDYEQARKKMIRSA